MQIGEIMFVIIVLTAGIWSSIELYDFIQVIIFFHSSRLARSAQSILVTPRPPFCTPD